MLALHFLLSDGLEVGQIVLGMDGQKRHRKSQSQTLHSFLFVLSLDCSKPVALTGLRSSEVINVSPS